uniref:Peroxin-3 n=1 Tax=Candidozyma auris TaxID=498019 RepID=A0A0L0NW23_CANAR
MPVFPTLAAFFRRHKKKLLWTSAVGFSLYLLVNQFVIKRFRNFQNSLKQELLVKEQLRRRFIQTQQDCYLTILALLPVLTQPVLNFLPTEAITLALKRKKNTNKEMSDSLTTENLMAHSSQDIGGSTSDLLVFLSKSKLELWHDLKVKSISRMLALIYSSAGLLLLTRLQLNILARKAYLELAIVMAGGSVPQNSQSSFDYFIEQSYLSLSWWLLNHGWMRVANGLETLVESKFKEITPKTEMTVETFTQMLSEINAGVIADGQLVKNLLFPTEYDSLIETLMNTNPELVNELENKESNLVKLINETNFIIANDFTLHVFSLLVRSGVDTLGDSISVALNPDNVPGRVHKLATFLAQLSVQSSVICDPQNASEDEAGTGNIYINNFNDLDELDEFSASIYSNFE